MKTVSDEFKQMCKSNTPSGAIGRIRVIEDDITIAENTDIQNISIEDNCYVNDKFVGTTVAKKVTVNLFNDDNIYDLENKEIEVKLGFQYYEEEQTYEGKNIQVLDAKSIKPEIQLHGETNQEGTPTPATPIEIKNIEGNVEVKVTGKNFLNVSSEFTVIQVVSNIPINIPIGTYVLSVDEVITDGALDKFLFYFYYDDGTTLLKTISSINKSISFTAEKTITKMNIYSQDLAVNSTGVTTTYKNLMISTEGGDYEPYKEQTATFPLSERQKLMERSYLADNGVHNTRKQVVLDGTEVWGDGVLTLDDVTGFTYTNANLFETGIVNAICDRQIYAYDYRGNYEHFYIYNGILFFYLKTSTASTKEELLTWLQNNPVTLEYELAEEEIVPYTEEQQESWNQFQNIMLYEGTNHITSNANLIITLGKELISFGNYIIEKPETEEVQAKTNFIGYDYMIKFNKLYIDTNTYPISLADYFTNLCNQVGVEVGNIDFVNADYMVQGNAFTNNEDCRTVLSAIAQIAGGIAKIGRDNKVYIINLSTEDALEEL